MNTTFRERFCPSFLRSPVEPTGAPPKANVIGDDPPEMERLLVLSARLRKKERELEDLRLELAEWERLLSAREDYLRTCEANVARPGRLSLEQREAALARRLREVKERERLVELQLAQSAFRTYSAEPSAPTRAAG